MSSALVRQALALVDPEEDTCNKSNKRKSGQPRRRLAGQDPVHPYKRHKKQSKQETKTKDQIAQDNIKKLLALSTPTADTSVSQTIVERAIKGRPLADKIEVIKDENKSILFPDEPFEQFEQELFCNDKN